MARLGRARPNRVYVGRTRTALDASVTGVVSSLSFAAPAGLVSTVTDASVTGVTATLLLGAPVGRAGVPVSVTGVTSTLVLGAPAGAAAAVATVAGVLSTLSLSAPAGVVVGVSNAVVAGLTSPLALSGPAGATIPAAVGALDSGGAPGYGILGQTRPPGAAPRRPALRLRRGEVQTLTLKVEQRFRVEGGTAQVVVSTSSHVLSATQRKRHGAGVAMRCIRRSAHTPETRAVLARMEDEELLCIAASLLGAR